MAAAWDDHASRDFLGALRVGDVCTGTATEVTRSQGVAVTLDGFLARPLGRVGPRVSCEFLQFDMWNGEARLSLRATQPDPFPAFADSVVVGQTLQGQVTKLVTFGFFVAVVDSVEGLVREAPEDVVQVGDEITVVVTEIDRARHRLAFSSRQAPPARA